MDLIRRIDLAFAGHVVMGGGVLSLALMGGPEGLGDLGGVALAQLVPFLVLAGVGGIWGCVEGVRLWARVIELRLLVVLSGVAVGLVVLEVVSSTHPVPAVHFVQPLVATWLTTRWIARRP